MNDRRSHPAGWHFVSLALVMLTGLVAAPAARTDPPGPDNPRTVAVGIPNWGYPAVTIVKRDPIADRIAAEGQFLIDWQRARLLGEDVVEKKIENRKREVEQWLQERGLRDEEIKRRNLRAHERFVDRLLGEPTERDSPSGPEIWSGRVHNDILKELIRRSPEDRSTPVRGEWLQRVHVRPSGAFSVALFKDKQLSWPFLLQRPLFSGECAKIDDLFERLKGQIDSENKVNNQDLYDMTKAVEELQESLGRRTGQLGDEIEWSPCNVIEAMRFLKDLHGCLRGLQRARTAVLALASPEGKTVAELVAHMRDRGLWFAAARDDDRPEYNALYEAMRAELRERRARQSSAAP